MPSEDSQKSRDAAKARIVDLLRIFRSLPDESQTSHVIYEAEQLEKALNAFHMEAIRFRMYSLDRFMAHSPSASPEARQTFLELKSALEGAGFHTR